MVYFLKGGLFCPLSTDAELVVINQISQWGYGDRFALDAHLSTYPTSQGLFTGESFRKKFESGS